MASPQIITVSGLSGSGTSTACETLCEKLGWAYVNAGRIFRELAEESGLSLAEFGERAEVDGRIDRQLDERILVQAKNQAPIVVEGRLTGWMAYRSGLAALKVWLAATPEVRAERVAQRESKSAAQALEELRAREGSEARRYEEFHQIDISDLSIYDVLIETEKTDPNAVVALIISRLKSA